MTELTPPVGRRLTSLTDERDRQVTSMFIEPLTIQEASERSGIKYHTIRKVLLKLVERNRISRVGVGNNGAVIYQSSRPETLPRFPNKKGDRISFFEALHAYNSTISDSNPRPVPRVAVVASEMYPQFIAYTREVMEAADDQRDINTQIIDEFTRWLSTSIEEAAGFMRTVQYILETPEFFDTDAVTHFPNDASWNNDTIRRAWNNYRQDRWYDIDYTVLNQDD